MKVQEKIAKMKGKMIFNEEGINNVHFNFLIIA